MGKLAPDGFPFGAYFIERLGKDRKQVSIVEIAQ